MTSFLLLENKEHKKEHSSLCFRERGTKRTFLVKSSPHSREQQPEIRNTSFKRTKKGTHTQFNAYNEKN